MAIVDHITAGSLTPSLDWLCNPHAAASAHYVVARSGHVFQLVADADAAWTQGVDFDNYAVYQSDLSVPWLAQCWRDRVSPNLVAIGIEHEANVGQPLTEPQIAATVQLHRWLCATYGIPADAEHIVGHSRIDAVSRGNDPGPLFPMARLLADLG